MTELAQLDNIETALLVEWTYDTSVWGESGIDLPNLPNLYFSDYYRPVEYAGNTYVALNYLLSVGETSVNMRSGTNSLSMSISGLNSENTVDAIRFFSKEYTSIKGSMIVIRRAFFDKTTGLLRTDLPQNPIGRYKGFVQNFTMINEFNPATRTMETVVTLNISDYTDYLKGITSGRKTNREFSYYDNDTIYDVSLHNVENLVGVQYEWGKKQ